MRLYGSMNQEKPRAAFSSFLYSLQPLVHRFNSWCEDFCISSSLSCKQPWRLPIFKSMHFTVPSSSVLLVGALRNFWLIRKGMVIKHSLKDCSASSGKQTKIFFCFFLCFSTFTAWIIKCTSHTKKLQTLSLTFPLCQKLILRNSSVQSVSKLLNCLHSGHLFDWPNKLKTSMEVWEWIQTSLRLFFLHFFFYSFFFLPFSCPHFFRLNESH